MKGERRETEAEAFVFARSRSRTAPLRVSTFSLLLHQAVCILRPTRANIAALRRALRAGSGPGGPGPRFGSYHLVFTNRVGDGGLQDLADADGAPPAGACRVSTVTEAFLDFEALDPHHFAVPVPRPASLLQPLAWDDAASSAALGRAAEGLAAVLLSLRRRFTIRYRRGSEPATRLAASLAALADGEERALFSFGSPPGEPPPLLLILDRRDDPATPLLLPWTYQAMAHELVGLDCNRARLPPPPGSSGAAAAQPTDLVLSGRQDPFFAAHAASNFGDAGTAVRGLVDEFARSRAGAASLATIADMQAAVEGYGELSAAQAAAAKHVGLLGELARVVGARGLMDVSAVEQEVVCGGGGAPGAGAGAHADAVRGLLADPRPSPADKVRAVALHALRHERGDAAARAASADLVSRLADCPGMTPRASAALVGVLLRHAGAARRSGDLFSDASLTARLSAAARAATTSLRGVDNVYTQHSPALVGLLEAALKGRLREADWPVAGAEGVNGGAGGPPGSASPTPGGGGGGPGGGPGAPTPPASAPPRLVVAFIIGGSTYQEAAAVAALNAAAGPGGPRVLLGGTGVLNSGAFLEALATVGEVERAHV